MKHLRLIIILALPWSVISAARTDRVPHYKVTRQNIEQLSPAMQGNFAGLQYLLNGYQTRQFMRLKTDDERKDWLRIFWRLRDPTPTTKKNEMMVEHNIRVLLAREFFRSKKWPGWDKRGEVFIRYGPPEYRGKIYGDVTLRGVDPPGELWYYFRHNMLVSFENFGLKGEFIYAIDPLGPEVNFSPEFTEFLLYDTNSSLGQKIPQQYLETFSTPTGMEPFEIFRSNDPLREDAYRLAKPRELQEALDAIGDPEIIEMLPKDVSAVFHHDRIREVSNNFEIVLEETPSSYPFNFRDNSLPFYFGIDQFKGGKTKTRVEVQVEMPIVVEQGGFEEIFRVEVVVWDPQFNEIERKGRDLVLRTGPEVTNWQNLIPTQLTLSLDPGYYRIAISVTSKKTGRSSSYKTNVTCRPVGRLLAMSDILFARRISTATQPSIFTRGALEVVPHPVRAYNVNGRLPIYFEVYNLSPDTRGITTYTVEYKIIPHKKDKKRFWKRFGETTPVVASKFQHSSYGRDDVQHITVNTDNLSSGSYDFLITLTDDLTGEIAFKKGTFSLIN